ncbi:MAG TPA: 3-hydroxyacyl-CoA dehydrogenase NAD-binding domain-containing protein [Thermohalobaculum sp.]|nr:3-hydroxyacyl-CoA dehydrogenase NAD-binding domain-containing protein [Thermohalobaculum sp.]
MEEIVRYAREGGVALVTVDNPPVNALGHAVRAGLKQAIERGIADAEASAIVIICAGRTFFAGADITEFGKPPQPPSLREVHEVMDASPKPLIAAIHGTALGGGLETALACHFRVATADAKLGLPEVKLGILPGAGGTQRLPRLVGVEKAIEMICTGEPIDARQARELGIVCAVVEGDLRAAALSFAAQVVAEGRALARTRERDHLVREAAGRPEVFQAAREHYRRTRRGMMAPQHCIAAVQAATEMDFEGGMRRERELFEELVRSDQSKALRHLFFAEREAAKIPGVSRDTPRREVGSVAVIGAGTMGTGIAMTFANAGLPVTLIEADQAALERGMGNVRKTYEKAASRGRIAPDEAAGRTGLITPALGMDAAAQADLVIEAVFEDMALKKQIFGTLDATAKAGAILATNTSTLDVNAIAAATKRARDVLGLHFFSPANIMRLLEVVRGEATAPDVLATCFALARRIGKVPVQAGVCHGFIGNRMLHAYFDQAFALLYEGALPQQVDKALYDFGLAMGPFAMSDLAGLDVSWRVRKEAGTTQPIADRLCELGRFGQKTGAGYYRYRNGSRTPLPDPEVANIVEEEGLKRHGERRRIAPEEIVERCMLALVNEGARILEEGIALRASDIDVVYVYGYGFPAWRGGPMFWADRTGLATVLERLRAHADAGRGEVLKPAPLIERLAGEARGFADRDGGAAA